MKTLNYLLKGFGFEKYKGFFDHSFKLFYIQKSTLFLSLSGILATIRMHFEHLIGLDVLVYISFYFDHSGDQERNQSSCCKKKGTFRVERPDVLKLVFIHKSFLCSTPSRPG
jgi:hypothetical protein